MSETTLSDLPGVVIRLPHNFTPRPNQIDDFYFACSKQVTGNWSEVGTGKSLVAFMYIAKQVSVGNKVLVAVPASLTLQFYTDFTKTIIGDISVERLSGDGKRNLQLLEAFNPFPDVLVMGYHQFTSYQDKFRNQGYNAVVVDEAHCLCNLTPKIYRIVSGLIHRRKFDALLLTATPHLSELAKAYGLISLTNPEAYIDFAHFEHKHIDYEKRSINGRDAMMIVDYRDVEGIHESLLRNAVRRRQSEVLTIDKPTIIETKVELDKRHAKAVNLIVKSWLIALTDDQLDAVDTAQKARMVGMRAITAPEQFATVGAIDWEDLPLTRLENVIQQLGTVEKVAEDGKLVIFCNFRDTVKKLAGVLSKYNPALVYGGSNTSEESFRFINDPTCRVVIANYKSGGSGHNWQGVSCAEVFYEPIADVAMIGQSIGRVSRSGQTKPVTIWLFNYAVPSSAQQWAKAKERAGILQEALGDSINFNDYIEVLSA
jgi:SNF2 family DNA or RNA helicase